MNKAPSPILAKESQRHQLREVLKRSRKKNKPSPLLKYVFSILACVYFTQYNISLMKAILGTGSLAIPFALQFVFVFEKSHGHPFVDWSRSFGHHLYYLRSLECLLLLATHSIEEAHGFACMWNLILNVTQQPSFQKSISVSCLYAKISYHVCVARSPSFLVFGQIWLLPLLVLLPTDSLGFPSGHPRMSLSVWSISRSLWSTS